MRQFHFKLFALALVVLTLGACNSKAKKIAVSEDKLAFTIAGGEKTVKVTADGSYEVQDSPEWLTVETGDSTVTVKAGENKTGAEREGNILLAGNEGVQVIIKVTQATKCTHITPESDKVEFEKEGGTQTVRIDTNGSPQVEAPEGFTATYANGVLTITTQANERGAKNGEIKLTCEDQSATIVVAQKGNICPRCNGTGKVKCSKCGGEGEIYHRASGDLEGCSACGGDRFLNVFRNHDYGFRKGSGKMKCPTCGGSGH